MQQSYEEKVILKSSAFPLIAQGQCYSRADIHGLLKEWSDLRRLEVESLEFKPVFESDIDELKKLHQEWFPIDYDDAFYKALSSNNVLSIVASCEYMQRKCILGAVAFRKRFVKRCSLLGRYFNNDKEPSADDRELLRGYSGIMGPFADSLRGTWAAYIMTLGVVDEFRRRGLGLRLISETVKYVEETCLDVGLIYLHVVEYNTPAMRLYEKCGFVRVGRIEEFYSIRNKPYACYVYAYYTAHLGLRPPVFVTLWHTWQVVTSRCSRRSAPNES